MQTEYAIEFECVTKVFPKAHVPSVKDCTFQVSKGEFVVILGASGSGKTTLLKMVNRLYSQTSGRILIHGVSIESIPPVALRRNMGYVIQQIGVYPHMTVEKNIATVPEICGWNKDKIRERVDSLLHLVHLPPCEYAKRFPRQLSGGQQQRVGIARALAGDPEIVLMDEPFGAVDAITRASLQEEIKRIQRELGKTLLFVTHDVDEALRLADRILVMEGGQIVQFDTPLNILSHPVNEFVRELIQADDIFKRLSLVPVQSAVEPFANEEYTAEKVIVRKDETLKDALSKMIGCSSDKVFVVDHDETLIGKVTLAGLSRVGK